jgi:tetratricopeptide (TPR) repeat protein
MFNMMGYVIFQYHEILEYRVRLEVDQEYSNKKQPKGQVPRSRNPIINEAQLLVKEGNIDEAIRRLKAALQNHNAGMEMHDYYHRLLVTDNNAKLMVEHARDYLNMLLYENKTRDAAKVIIDCFKFKEIVRPADPDRYFAIASVLYELRAFKECVALLQNFHTAFSGHEDIPKLYLLCARALSDGLQNDKIAEKILAFLGKHYQQHELAEEIQQYHRAVKSVLAQ